VWRRRRASSGTEERSLSRISSTQALASPTGSTALSNGLSCPDGGEAGMARRVLAMFAITL